MWGFDGTVLVCFFWLVLPLQNCGYSVINAQSTRSDSSRTFLYNSIYGIWRTLRRRLRMSLYTVILLPAVGLKVVGNKLNKSEMHVWLDVFVSPPGTVTTKSTRIGRNGKWNNPTAESLLLSFFGSCSRLLINFFRLASLRCPHRYSGKRISRERGTNRNSTPSLVEEMKFY